MTTRFSKLLHACLAILAVALFSGCGDSEEPAKPAEKPQAERAAPKAVTPSPKPIVRKVPLKTIEEQLETNVDIPERYPADAPIYPGAKTNTAQMQRGAMTAVFSTSDTPEQVSSFVEDHFSKQGWSDVEETEMPGGGAAYQAYKGNRVLKVVVATLDAGGESRTLMMVSTDPK